MKQIFIILSAFLLAASMMAQEKQEINMLSKRGVPILPEKGDLGLGVNALPMLDYFGNMFNGHTNNSTGFGFITGLYDAFTLPRNNIYVKYYLTDKSAIRGVLGVTYTKTSDRELVTQNATVPDPDIKVTDICRNKSINLGLGADYLMYRGKGRVQGYFGGGMFINYGERRTNYEYGNPITTEFSAPTYFDFANGLQVSGSERPLENYNKTFLGVALRGVIGVEYFFAPKISLGGEMGLGFRVSQTSNFNTVERWTGTEREVETIEQANDGNLVLANFASGSIHITFHF